MKCNELMNMNLQWVPGTATVAEAARIMRDRSIGFLLVSGDEAGKPVGVLTDRDIAIRCCAEGQRTDETLVVEIASKPLMTCDREANLKDAEALMIASEKSRLVIVDEIGRAVGVLSLTDVLYHDSSRRALRTARGVLAREADGAHEPVEGIKLTPSTVEDEERAMHHSSAVHGGSWDTTVKMFP